MSSSVSEIGTGIAIGKIVAGAPTEADLALSDRVLARIEASVAENTRRAYRTDWIEFAKWCAASGRSALPATPQTLAEFVSGRADQGRAPASISRAISSIRVAHRANGFQPTDTLAARAVLKTYKNERASNGLPNGKPAAMLTLGHLRKMSEILGAAGGAMGQRDRLVLVLGWVMMARRSELIGLDIADVAETEAGLDVTVRKSKADQSAEGRIVAVPCGSDAATCPVRLMRAWLALLASRGITSGPLLRRVDNIGRIAGETGFGKGLSGRVTANQRLSLPAIGIILRRAALAAGVSVKDLSPHSLRAGGATGAYLGGADLLSIGRHGGWDDNSPVLAKYIRGVDRWQKNPMRNAGL